MKTAILLLILAVNLTAHADLAVKARAPISCESINYRSVPVGTVCLTSKEAVYTRVSRLNFGEAWQGPDGLIWSDRVGSDTQDNAIEICKELGGTLPEKNNFVLGEVNGFREVLPNMIYQLLWTSSVGPNGPYVFFGNNGSFDDYYTNWGSHPFRCVGH